MCLKLTRIISDTIAESEKTAVTLADCLLRFLVIYKATALLDFPLLYGELKQHCLSTIQRRFEEYFRNPIYVVALFLHPKYKSLAISSELYNTKDAYGDIIFFASVWRFTKAEVRDMREAVRDYSKGIGYFADFDGVVTYPTEWWRNVKSKQPGIEGLRKLAILVHGIVPHVADIERMFSLLGYQHTKSRNNMSTSTLKKIGQLKRYLSLEKTRQVEFEKVERRGDSHKKNSAVKRDCGATLQRDIDMAEDENADNNEDNDGIAASEDDETFCMLAELEQGSSMEDKHQRRLCLTSSRLDATRRSDVERVAAETMLELWLSIISEEDESESSKAVLASNGAASSSTRNHRQSGHMLFGWRLALARTTKIGDLFDLNSTVLMATF
uniref:Predicted protein putative n=1 Tax=Albugo laibachii Nc14 TaxID=890382 RepID=F0X1P2_9STRA|nr:predicted protein putative [Albugo laibachii Nc14]|eukprot:CCA27740.1 predicted protein putative [Albugo laibachii Nc14]